MIRSGFRCKGDVLIKLPRRLSPHLLIISLLPHFQNLVKVTITITNLPHSQNLVKVTVTIFAHCIQVTSHHHILVTLKRLWRTHRLVRFPYKRRQWDIGISAGQISGLQSGGKKYH